MLSHHRVRLEARKTSPMRRSSNALAGMIRNASASKSVMAVIALLLLWRILDNFIVERVIGLVDGAEHNAGFLSVSVPTTAPFARQLDRAASLAGNIAHAVHAHQAVAQGGRVSRCANYGIKSVHQPLAFSKPVGAMSLRITVAADRCHHSQRRRRPLVQRWNYFAQD